MMEVAALISLGVSLLALGVATLALYKNWQLSDRQIQHLDEERSEQRKADVRVSLVRQNNGYRFCIQNFGPGEARNVQFMIEAEGGSSPLVSGDYDEKMPTDFLRNGDSVSLIAALNVNSRFSFPCVWNWEDEDGQTQERRQNVARQ
jgi:hypothetical protein